MKNKIVLITILTVLFITITGCGKEQNNFQKENNNDIYKSEELNKEEKFKINPFKLDAVYISWSGIIDPVTEIGISDARYFEVNPKYKEENLTENSEIDIIVLASINSLDDGEKDLELPKSIYKSYIPSNVLNLKLKIAQTTEDTICEINDYNKKITRLLGRYECGRTFKSDDILFAGSGESKYIAGVFSVKYHYYKQALKDDSDIELNWDNKYTLKFKASQIIKENSLSSINSDLKKRNLLNNKS